jgi:hypothetical protein
MIVIIEGKINSGKTLLLAKLTKDRMQETERKVICRKDSRFNFECEEFEHCDFVSRLLFLQKSGYFHDLIVPLDESYAYYDARSSFTERMNSLLNLLMTSKNVDVFLTTLYLDYVDKRLRRARDYVISCRDGYEDGSIHFSSRDARGGTMYGSLPIDDLIGNVRSGANTRSFTDDENFMSRSLGEYRSLGVIG